MAHELKEIVTPGGTRVLRLQAEGYMDEATNEAMEPVMYANTLPMLVVLKGDLKLSTAGRKSILSKNNARPIPVAIVSESAATRAMITFFIKTVALVASTKIPNAAFSDEAAAMQWLDAQQQQQRAVA